MAHEAIDLALAGLRANVDRMMTEARQRAKNDTAAVTAAAEKTLKAAADTSIRKLEKRIEELQSAQGRGPLAWAAVVGGLVVLLAYIGGVWAGDHGITVLQAFGLGWV